MASNCFKLRSIPNKTDVLFLLKHLPALRASQKRHSVTGNIRLHSITRGLEHIRSRSLNKGLAFSRGERFAYGIYGLLPPMVKTMEEQMEVCKIRLNSCRDALTKYEYLIGLHSRYEKLFFRLLTKNLNELMPIVYTPTVAQAVLNFGIIYRPLRALFVCIHDKGHLRDVIKNWPSPDVSATVMTDGERCLGLGDMSINAVCISVGKMGLYTALGGVKPNVCMPIVIDAGTNNPDLLEDPFYLGLRQKRISGEEYDEFIEELVQAIISRFGQKMVIQFEDFSNANAFRYLAKYRNRYCAFNDDIQGTAGAGVSGLITSKRILGKQLKEHRYLFFGAGQAAVGIAGLCCKFMVEKEGISIEEARKKIRMYDKDGLLTKDRPEGLEINQSVYAIDHAPSKNFLEVLKEFKPSVLIGVSTVGRTFTPEILRAMGSFTERPIIMALSNPNQKAECTPKEAYENTEGRAIYASGSPFGTVEYGGKIYKPGLANNAYIYPGIALGGIIGAVHHITEEVEVMAAECVCDCTTDEDLKVGSLYPPFGKIQEVSFNIACRMLEYGIKHKMTRVYPEPKDVREYVRRYMYNYEYDSKIAQVWDYPKPPHIKVKPLDMRQR